MTSEGRTSSEGMGPMAKNQTETIDRERYLLLKGMLEDRRREIHEKLRSLRESIPADTHRRHATPRSRASTTSCRRSTSPSCR